MFGGRDSGWSEAAAGGGVLAGSLCCCPSLPVVAGPRETRVQGPAVSRGRAHSDGLHHV